MNYNKELQYYLHILYVWTIIAQYKTSRTTMKYLISNELKIYREFIQNPTDDFDRFVALNYPQFHRFTKEAERIFFLFIKEKHPLYHLLATHSLHSYDKKTSKRILVGSNLDTFKKLLVQHEDPNKILDLETFTYKSEYGIHEMDFLEIKKFITHEIYMSEEERHYRSQIKLDFQERMMSEALTPLYDPSIVHTISTHILDYDVNTLKSLIIYGFKPKPAFMKLMQSFWKQSYEHIQLIKSITDRLERPLSSAKKIKINLYQFHIPILNLMVKALPRCLKCQITSQCTLN